MQWRFRYLGPLAVVGEWKSIMPTDIIEMFWGCLLCKGENKGRFKTCQSCGKPRTSDSPEWMPDDISPMAAIKDQDLLSKFKSGPDWQCKFCNSSQFRADGNCAQCGSPRTMSEQEASEKRVKTKAVADIWAAEVLRKAKEEQNRREEKGDTEPPPFREQTGGYRDPAVRAVDPEPVTAAIDATPSSKVSLVGVIDFIARLFPSSRTLAISVCALVFATGLYFLLRTKEVDVTVESVSWDRVVHVDRYTTVHHDGWSPDGDAFNIQEEGRRIHHYDHVRVGSHTEHYTERVACGQDCRTVKGSCYTTSRTCTSNKNGSATCTGGDRVCSPDTTSCTTRYCNQDRTRTVDDYVEQPAYRMWYSWDRWEWVPNRDVHETGSTLENVSWPSEDKIHLGKNIGPGENERERGRDESFSVVMRDSEDSYTYHPKTESEFGRFSVGSPHHLKVGLATGVEVVR